MGLVLHQLEILLGVIDSVHGHPPLKAAANCRGFIRGEIMPGMVPQADKNLA
jgi:hypothetical protein